MENIVTAPKTDMFRFRINPEIRKQVEEVYAKNGLTFTEIKTNSLHRRRFKICLATKRSIDSMKSMGDLLKRAIGQSEKLPPKYWTEGWNKFSFLMTPEQVKEVFEAYHLIIINSSVPIDYVESELSEYLSAYSETYKQLCSGEKVTTCSLDLWRGITSNLARCRYGEIRLRDGKQYKRATFDEPVVAVVPGRLGLGRYDDGKLFCSTAYTMVTEDFMGIQFHYPKKVQYEKNGVCGPWFSTKDLNSYQDFENLKTTIRGMTHPLTLKSGDEQRRLDIRITDEAREQIRGCYLFREYGVTVK